MSFRASAIIMIFFLAGCQPNFFVRGEYGYGSQWFLAKLANDYQTGLNSKNKPLPSLPADGHYLSLSLGAKTQINEHFDTTLAAGPVILSPTKGPTSEYVGFEIKPRIIYTDWIFHPYLEGIAGVGNTSKRWRGEGTHHLFSVGGSLGVAVPLTDSWEFDAGYRFYHLSNGSAIFGSPKPNVGYNTDMLYLGFQYNF